MGPSAQQQQSICSVRGTRGIIIYRGHLQGHKTSQIKRIENIHTYSAIRQLEGKKYLGNPNKYINIYIKISNKYIWKLNNTFIGQERNDNSSQKT